MPDSTPQYWNADTRSTLTPRCSNSGPLLLINSRVTSAKTLGWKITDSNRMNSMIEAPFEMANLFPKHTGLPFVVWISVRGGARHDVRVKVSASAKAIPGEMITVGIRPDVQVIEGEM